MLLGRALPALVRDPDTCRMAVLQPGLGVPFIFEEMLDFLTKRLDSVPQVRGETWDLFPFTNTFPEARRS